MIIFKERRFDLKPFGEFSLFSPNWTLRCYIGTLSGLPLT
jgi:hypothetical protein